MILLHCSRLSDCNGNRLNFKITETQFRDAHDGTAMEATNTN